MSNYINVPIEKIRVLLIFITMAWILVACTSSTETSTPTPEIADQGPQECSNRVLVVVWGDLNGDGVQSPDEPNLANVSLMIAPKGDSTSDGIQLSTNKDGKAHFPTRELKNCQTSGYQDLFLRQVVGYEFPTQPLVDLNDFDPIDDIVRFGLLPMSENDD